MADAEARRAAADVEARPVGLGWRLVAAAVAVFLRVLGRTWRVRIEGEDAFTGPEPAIGVIWHQGLLAAAYCWRGRGFATPVSASRDGSRIDAVLRHLGFAESPRGSSSRRSTRLLRRLI